MILSYQSVSLVLKNHLYESLLHFILVSITLLAAWKKWDDFLKQTQLFTLKFMNKISKKQVKSISNQSDVA